MGRCRLGGSAESIILAVPTMWITTQGLRRGTDLRTTKRRTFRLSKKRTLLVRATTGVSWPMTCWEQTVAHDQGETLRLPLMFRPLVLSGRTLLRQRLGQDLCLPGGKKGIPLKVALTMSITTPELQPGWILVVRHSSGSWGGKAVKSLSSHSQSLSLVHYLLDGRCA